LRKKKKVNRGVICQYCAPFSPYVILYTGFNWKIESYAYFISNYYYSQQQESTLKINDAEDKFEAHTKMEQEQDEPWRHLNTCSVFASRASTKRNLIGITGATELRADLLLFTHTTMA